MHGALDDDLRTVFAHRLQIVISRCEGIVALEGYAVLLAVLPFARFGGRRHAGVHAVELGRYARVRVAQLHQDVAFQVVLPYEVEIRVTHGRIATRRVARDVKRVIVPLGHIEARFVHSVEDRRGHLADTPADRIDELAVDDGARRPETSLLVRVTGAFVEVPIATVCLDHRICEDVGGQLDVMVAILGSLEVREFSGVFADHGDDAQIERIVERQRLRAVRLANRHFRGIAGRLFPCTAVCSVQQLIELRDSGSDFGNIARARRAHHYV